MTKLRTNVVASYAGQAWLALMAIAFVPMYLDLLGAESFGLVGFMLSLHAASQLLDLGIGSAVNRELARRAHGAGDRKGVRDLVRTYEAVVWPMAALLGLAILAAAPWIATHWLNPDSIGTGRTAEAVALMSAAIAGLWPAAFYGGALAGLERQVQLNAVNALFATLRYAGVLAAMRVFGTTVEVFIVWNAVVGAAQSATLAALAWRALPPGPSPKARWDALAGTKRFAGGMFAISASALVLSHFDRFAISVLRPLSEMGYYSLAISVSAGLGRLVLPMFNALYPRFSRLVAEGDSPGLVALYHTTNQWSALVIAATAAVLVAFAPDVLWLWTGDSQLVEKVTAPMAVLVLGSAFNGLLVLPYALQLAHGATRLALAANLVALVLAVPVGYFAIASFGLVGAACIWLGVNLGNFAIAAPLAHRRWLPGELGSWYLRDILPPFAAAAAAALLLRAALPPLRGLDGLLTLMLVCATVLAATAAATPTARGALLGRMRAGHAGSRSR